MKLRIKQVTEVDMSLAQMLILDKLGLQGYKQFVVHTVVNRYEDWYEMYALDALQVYGRIRKEAWFKHNLNRYDRRK